MMGDGSLVLSQVILDNFPLEGWSDAASSIGGFSAPAAYYSGGSPGTSTPLVRRVGTAHTTRWSLLISAHPWWLQSAALHASSGVDK